MRSPVAAVSVDLDEVTEYTRIHGLAAFGDDALGRHAVYERAVGRIEGWARALSIPITFFAVGRDLTRAANAAAMRRMVGLGHAVESHSLSHRYDLSRLRGEALSREVNEGLLAVERATGARPSGFRAPGYTLSDPLFDALEEAGVRFDSSVFPSPFYYGAKAAVLGWMRLRGRASASILDTPAVLAAPRVPYRPGERWYRRAGSDAGEAGRESGSPQGGSRAQRRGSGPQRGRRFVELPIQVTPLLGFPVIGTSVGRSGAWLSKGLALACAGEPLVNLELHGMDFLEAEDLGDHPLTRLQPELLAPLSLRMERLTIFVETLRSKGLAFVTLAEASERFAASG